jgi:hypothetical protein
LWPTINKWLTRNIHVVKWGQTLLVLGYIPTLTKIYKKKPNATFRRDHRSPASSLSVISQKQSYCSCYQSLLQSFNLRVFWNLSKKKVAFEFSLEREDEFSSCKWSQIFWQELEHSTTCNSWDIQMQPQR